MTLARPAGLVLALCVAPGPALAGAWPTPKGETQVIVKYEDQRADEGFDPNGERLPLLAQRVDREASIFVEHGLTDSLTLQLKGAWQQGRDAFVDYEGRGPVEIGLRWRAWSDERRVVSLYAGHVAAGEGRNAGYAAPGEGDGDWELRVLGGAAVEVIGRPGWLELQAARMFRSGGLRDETRLDATAGLHLTNNWTTLAQAYGGVADDDGPAWLHVEASVVRRFGDWSLQAGWRETVYGREVAASSGPVVAVWRRF